MHRRRAYSTIALPLSPWGSSAQTARPFVLGPLMCPFLKRTARRREKRLRALGHTRMIYPIVGIVGIVCTITAPSSWKLLDPCVTNGSPVRECACGCVCLDGYMHQSLLVRHRGSYPVMAATSFIPHCLTRLASLLTCWTCSTFFPPSLVPF